MRMRNSRMSRRTLLGASLALAGARPARGTEVVRAQDGRDVRVAVWGAAGERRGLVLFSHGALSSPDKYERVAGRWASAGFDVMAPLHVDSLDHPDHAKYGMLESWSARLQDMRALAARADAPSFVAAGHSYGGLVALTLGGALSAVPPGVEQPLRDRRAGSVVALSPPGASPGLITKDGYAGLAVPAFIQTGTQDVPPGPGDGRWQVHLDAFEAAPAGDKYALVLDGADHYFGGLICRLDRPGPPQDAPLDQALTLSTLFLEAFGAGDGAARATLDAALSDAGPARLSRK